MEYLINLVEEDYKKWTSKDLVFLFSGTGSGKTTFVLQKVSLRYLQEGKKVLYLVPRKILQEQINQDMIDIKSQEPDRTAEYNENFVIWTYQSLEESLEDDKKRKKISKSFDLVICDEFHYFITDAAFNANTRLSYRFIFYHIKGLKLFLSATPYDMMKYLEKKLIFKMPKRNIDINFKRLELDIKDTSDDKYRKYDYLYEKKKCKNLGKVYIYNLPKDYNYLDIKYIRDDKEIMEIIKNPNEKTLIFVSSKKNGKNLDEKINEGSKKKKSIFITAENKNTDTKKDVETIVKTDTFSTQVLITTSVLDVGVNFLDADIKNIVIAASEPVELLQMLGRLRVIQEEQSVSLYIYMRNAEYFQNLRDRLIVPSIRYCEFIEKYKNKSNLKDLLEEEFTHKVDLPENCTINDLKKFLYYDCISYPKEIAFNDLAIYRFRQLYTLYNKIDEGISKDENYFIKKQLEWLGLENTFSPDNFYCFEIKKIYIQKLQEEIEKNITEINNNNSILDNKKIQKLLSEFKILIRNIDNNSVRSNNNLSVKIFNSVCNSNNIPYRIGQTQEKIEKKPKTIYYLVKENDEKIETLNLKIPYR